MKHFDLFSGYGGFTLALEKIYGNKNSIGFTTNEQSAEKGLLQDGNISVPNIGDGDRGRSDTLCVSQTIGFSEIDKYANAVLKHHWSNTKNYGDITKINWAEVPDFDLLTGGSPCQDLSIAGKRAGLDGARSGLFFEYIRAVKEKRPKYFIWENVKGALSSNKGFDFATVLNEFSETGYSLWWQVLNAKDFGVPQNRERIFIIGFRDGSAPEIFFERESDKQTGGISQLNSPRHSNDRVYSVDGSSPTLNTAQGGNRQPKIITSTLTTENAHGFGKNVTASQAFDIASITGNIRRLTPVECERLMGLPDNWLKYGTDENGKQFEISDTQRYKMAGNGVVVNVVEHLLREIIMPLDNIKQVC